MTTLPLITLLGAATILSLYMGRLVKKIHLPSLVGYMVLGVLLGGSVFGFLTEENINSLGFLTDVALGFVAFTI